MLWISYMVLWAAVLIFTNSKTSLGVVVIAPLLFFVLNTCSQFLRLNISSVLLNLVLLTFLALALSMVALGDPLGIEQLWNSDQSFTGRVPIWKLVLHQANGHWFFGHGFGSLWGVGYDAPNLRSPYEYIAVLNQGHNGYLDILATLGVLGLTIWMIVLLHFGAASESLRSNAPAVFVLAWLVMLFFLLHNSTESTILVPFNPVWHLTLFSIVLVSRSAVESG
jgi:exopolysaccharide production protein ExoQ